MSIVGAGTFTVTGTATVNGALSFGNETALVSTGIGATFTANGSASLGSTSLFATDGGVIDLSTVVTYPVGGDGGTFLQATGTGSQLLLPNMTTLTGFSRHGQVVIQSRGGGLIDMSALTTIPSGTTQISALDAGSVVDVSSLDSWDDSNFARISSLTWGDGGVVRVDSLRSVTNVSMTATNGTVMVLPTLQHYGGFGDSSSIASADGAGSRLEFPVLTTMNGSFRRGQVSFQAMNGGFIDMPTLAHITHGSVQISAFDKDVADNGSGINMHSLIDWFNNNSFRESFLKFGRGGTVDVASLASMTSVSIYATDGDTVRIPVLQTYSGQGDNTSRLTAIGANSRLELPLLATLGGSGRRGQVEIVAEVGGFVDMPALAHITHGSVQVSAFDKDVADNGSGINMHSLIDWFNDNKFRDSFLTFGRAGTVDVTSLLSMTNVSIYATDGDTVNVPALTAYHRLGDNISTLRADGNGSRVELPLLTVIDGIFRHGQLNLQAFDGGYLGLSGVTSTTGTGQTELLSRDAGSVVDLSSLENWSQQVSMEFLSGGVIQLNPATSTVSSGTLIFNPNGSINVGTLELGTNAAVIGTGTLNGNLTVNGGGTVSAGRSAGQITINGNLVLNSGSIFSVDVNGNTPGTEHDQVIVNGTVSINGGTLIGTTGTLPTVPITIISNDGVDAISGIRFAGAPNDGNTVTIGGQEYGINYTGDSGNDVVLTAVLPNTPPVAQDDGVSADEDSPLLINVLADNGQGADFDADNNIVLGLTTNLTVPLLGTLINHNDGTFTYDPAGAFESLAVGQTANVSFDYQIEDSFGETATATVTITINGANDTPTVSRSNATVTVNEGGVAGNSGSFDDADLSDIVSITATGVGGAAIGAISQDIGNSGNWTWSFNSSDGPDESQTVAITATDSNGASNTTSFDLVVNNVAPTADDATFEVVENSADGTAVGTVTASDPGNDTLAYNITGGTGATAFAIDSSTGAITVADSTQLDFETTPSFTLELTVTDDDGAADTANVTINLLNQASISGTVYVDTDRDGQFDANEVGVDGVMIELLDEFGDTVFNGQGDAITAVTSNGGFYLFEDLDPNTYQVHELQPTGIDDGAEQLGSLGGTIVANDTMQLTLARTDALDYVFSELGQMTSSGDTATIGFWQNKHGQQLITQGGTALAEWLSTNFGNIFGDELQGAGGQDVADFYKQELFKQKAQKSAGPAKVDAQFMAVALATYFTSGNLAGNLAADFGFNVTDTGIGTKIVNVGSSGAAFGVADLTDLTIMQLLMATNDLTDSPDNLIGFAHIYDRNGDGVIDAAEAQLRSQANTLYTLINEQGGI